jgi:transposase
MADNSDRSRLKAVPWAAMLQAGIVIGGRWRSLSEKERARLTRLLRASGGRPRNLTEKQRKELRKLAGKLDLGGMGSELMALRRRRARRARRGRRG